MTTPVPIDELRSWGGISLNSEMTSLLCSLRGTGEDIAAEDVMELLVKRHLVKGCNTAALLISIVDKVRAEAVSQFSDPRWRDHGGDDLACLLHAGVRAAREFGHHQLGTEHLLWILLDHDRPPMLSVIKRVAKLESEIRQSLGSAVETFFERSVRSQIKTPYHVQYKRIPSKDGVDCVQRYAVISETRSWIGRAYARSHWREFFFLIHWNGPDKYSESLVLPILNTFEPLEDAG